ncbi:MAG TPA: YqgE/AlgH family protein [Pirellulales bacterium]|jgi:putative transcriptional regulator
MRSLQGQLLVASPALLDPNFRQTVVLIVRHTADDGALGLVLNRQTQTSIKELWERLGESECASDAQLSLGGPCEGPLMALHAERGPEDIEVAAGIYFSSDTDRLTQLLNQSQDHARFFFGYAGWGPGQLEMELEEGAWSVGPAGTKHVFAIDQGLWERTAAEAAGWEVLSALKIRDVPPNPSLN